MSWGWLILGLVVSTLLMLLLATKWKFPKRLAWPGASLVALVAALPFAWLYTLVDSDKALLAVLLGQIAVALALGLSLVLVRFWRDPERTPPSENGLVLSPADGTISHVRRVDAGSTPLASKGGKDYHLHELAGTTVLEGAVHLIGVEMTFLDVHVNRCPISGRVEWLRHFEGKFISLRKEEAPFLNARLTSVIENPSLTVGVVQVASRLVRRVESYLNVGQAVSAGQRLGIIRFGSLVAVILPQREDIDIQVAPGDYVTAGETILARYREDARQGDK